MSECPTSTPNECRCRNVPETREREVQRDTRFMLFPQGAMGVAFRNAGFTQPRPSFGGREERPFISDLKLNSPEPARMESGWGDSKFVKDAS